MPYIKKLNENKFISMCEEYYKINSIDDEYIWNVDHGITPACLQSICIKYKISHYAYDIYNKCFLKNIGNRNYPVLCNYGIHDHQYLIQNKDKVKSLVEKSKKLKNINFSSSNLDKDEKKYTFWMIFMKILMYAIFKIIIVLKGVALQNPGQRGCTPLLWI